MLYDQWREVASKRANQLALMDLATDQRWTFGQLADAAEATVASQGRVLFPTGNSADFILCLLHGWFRKTVVCPLEANEQRPKDVGSLPAEIVHLKLTSATGGVPRLVAFTAGQIMADAENIVSTMGLRSDWPNLGVISLAHSYGFSNLVLPLLLHGIPLILAGGALPELLRRAAKIHRGVTLAAVPALWQSWHDAGAIPENVRLAISAGAPLPLVLEEIVFTRHELKIHNFYGSSECGGIAYDRSLTPRSEMVYAGTPLDGVQVSTTESGCLEVRSEAVGETYWPKPSPALREGVFRTSDLGEVVARKVYLRGRTGDQINVAGRKVAPEVIEQVLSNHPSVRGCLAFGVPSLDTQRGEIIVACVAAASNVTNQDLKQFALEKLPAWQVPREWWLVDSLEVNGRGKLSRTVWRKRYLEQSDNTIDNRTSEAD
jgi:acyl-CoA synthetase (AMP-forming)/AMP-acid ligase II